MLNALRYLRGEIQSRPVFVVGIGRSGTHWLAQTLEKHPDVRATIEMQPIFRWTTALAVNPHLEKKIWHRLLWNYRFQLMITAPRLYVDKSHPNMWFAEKLLAAFPRALFLGIERNPYASIASMLRHGGGHRWRNWRQFPIPNRYLGITEEIAQVYDDMPEPARCALRIVAHRKRWQEMKNTLGSAFKLLSYEEFAQHPEETLEDVQTFLGLDKPIPAPHVDSSALDKWKKQLTPEKIEQIQSVLQEPPDL